MKRKISVILSFLFLSVFLWAQNPTKNFPYYYYNSKEKSFSSYEYYLSGESETIEDNDEHTIKMYKSGNTYYIWVKYKYLVPPVGLEGDIRQTLKVNKDVAKNLDTRLDKKQYKDMDVCLIFTNRKNELICSAYYSEDY